MTTEGMVRHLLLPHDPVLQSCLSRLSGLHSSEDANNDGPRDEAARRLILQIVHLSGGGTPDWHDDMSAFDRRTLRNVVDHIDAHLKIAPFLSDMGICTGLSPSHFARKFRNSTGLSLHRFVNYRRILAALESLKDQSTPLAHVAAELGFSSQSHFTRLFSNLTGMTPAKYRNQFRPTVG